MSYQQPTIITRKARLWPQSTDEVVTLPTPPVVPVYPRATMLMTFFFSLTSMIVYGVVCTSMRSSAVSIFLVPCIVIGGLVAICSLIVYILQVIRLCRRADELRSSYQKRAGETERFIQRLYVQERQALMDAHPPLHLTTAALPMYEHLSVTPLIKRSFDNQDIHLWARRSEDADFLAIRIGTGLQSPSFQVRESDEESSIERDDPYRLSLQAVVKRCAQMMAPVTVSLRASGPVALFSSSQQLARSRELARAMLMQLAYHHSPEDVRVIVLAPQSEDVHWQWTTVLPHTRSYDPRFQTYIANEPPGVHSTVALGTSAVLEQLASLSRELSRRQLVWQDSQQRSVVAPHLVIIVDHFDPVIDLDEVPGAISSLLPKQIITAPLRQRAALTTSPLKRPELALALNQGKQLGVSIICLCTEHAELPASSSVLVDLDATPPPPLMLAETTPLPSIKRRALPWNSSATERVPWLSVPMISPQAIVSQLQPHPFVPITCLTLDSAPMDMLHLFAQHIQPLRANRKDVLELRTQVDLRMLFEPPLDVLRYQPQERWNDPLFRQPSFTGKSLPLMRIPIGLKVGDEVQYLDFLKDGPHGLLVGQSGAGKSELLQTILTSLAVAYKPTEVQYFILDATASLALEPFRQLPHTISFLADASSVASVQRCTIMLRAEMARREQRIREGRTLPRLLLVLNEFTALADGLPAFQDDLCSIARAGRELGIHLLLTASQADEMVCRMRDYVQYRLCLRCSSPQESNAVLHRVDAASLLPSMPGRSYLLHGDNQLDLFQAARVTLPVQPEQARPLFRYEPSTDKQKATLFRTPTLEK